MGGGGPARRTACPSGRGARCPGRGQPPPGTDGSAGGRAGAGAARGAGRRAPRVAAASGAAREGPCRQPALWLRLRQARRGRLGVGGGPAPGRGPGGPPSAYHGWREARGSGRGARAAAAGGRRAARWGRRRRRGKGRWRSRGGRSSLFVFVARWLPASHHVTRTRGRRAAPSAAAASRRGPAGSDPHGLAGSPRALLGRPARPPPPQPPGT